MVEWLQRQHQQQNETNNHIQEELGQIKKTMEAQQKQLTNISKAIAQLFDNLQKSVSHIQNRLEQTETSTFENNSTDNRRSSPQSLDSFGTNPRVLYTQTTTMPKFNGDLMKKHPIQFLQELVHYFKKIQVNPEQQLDLLVESMEGPAADWFTIYRPTWITIEDFQADFLHSFWSDVQQNQLRHQIGTTVWSVHNGMTMVNHFAHYVSLARRLTTPISEKTLVNQIIKHFPPHIQSLWMLKGETTIAGTAEFLRQQESIITSITVPPRPNISENTSAKQYPSRPPQKMDQYTWTKGNRNMGNAKRSS